ncbi:MAG: SMP-30/gluconolactonase/LRE family protein [Dehalococcoidales bacterium]|nr:SMP-30/gluconolactonase/LRE family protein [Dehalococcoidales bacterium]
MEFTIQEHDSALKHILPENPSVQQIATGFGFTEGPLWAGNYLLFSDIPRNRIIRLDMLHDGPELTTFRRPSGKSNGLTFDESGRLIACESHTRRVTLTEVDGTVRVLADSYQGKRLNSPNDVIAGHSGCVYFTDPFTFFDGPKPPKELDFHGVFRVTAEGKLKVVADDYKFPNGLAFSPDQSVLYVNDTADKTIRAYDVSEDGSTSNERLFIKMESDIRGGPDGMKVDTEGNVYCTGPGGFWIISPEGKHLGTVSLPELPSNMCWGDYDFKTLYITARTSVFRMRFNVPGIPAYKIDPEPWPYIAP